MTNLTSPSGSLPLTQEQGSGQAVPFYRQGQAALLSALQGKSVKDFGAVGDGVTNDSAAIASALASGGAIFFPAGNYLSGQQIISTAGQALFGEGVTSIVTALSPSAHLFNVQAANVQISNLRLNGAATAAANSTFAVFTDAAAPAPYLCVSQVLVSGASAALGFNNALKFDTGADFATVQNSRVERLQGSASGFGYGVLCGLASNCKINSNVFSASAGRGRHAVYLSAGSSFCLVEGNTVSGFDAEGITQYSVAPQAPCIGNIYSNNQLLDCVLPANVFSGAIGIYGRSSQAQITGNLVRNSGGKGIVVDGTGTTACQDTVIQGNTVSRAGLIGIDVIAGVRGLMQGNTVQDSSRVDPGVYANIRLVSDNVTASSGWLISGNFSFGSSTARSAFQLNASAPAPFGLTVSGNKFEPGSLATVELGGVVCAIDGRLRFSIALTPPSIAKGAAFTSGNLAVPGAVLGDTLAWSYRGFSGNCDGCVFTVSLSANGIAKCVIANLSAVAKTPAAGLLDIDVIQRGF
jgi:Pectate lyase superfamily protein